jgi:putative ABC transport system substrate-binding protein
MSSQRSTAASGKAATARVRTSESSIAAGRSSAGRRRSVFNGRREQLVTLAAHYSIPTMYELREYALAGGLMSYGTNLVDAYRQVGNYAARVLKGDKPVDLPVVQSSKFELVINLKTAKALRLMIPAGVLAIADEVIE